MAYSAVFGVPFVDVKGFPFSKYVSTGRNLGSVRIVHGGVSRNVCEDFANVGMPIEFVSITDKTCIGQDVLTNLNAIGVKTDYITTVEENGVGMWLAVMNEHGDLAGSISQMPDVDSLAKYISENGDEIVSECENVILEMDMSAEISAKIIELAEKYNKNVYVIVGNMSVILAHTEYLSRISCFICNEIEAGRLFDMYLGDTTPKDMLELLKVRSQELGIHSMVITMGSRGSVYCDNVNGVYGICSTFPTKLVDSTGAGDAFFAGTVMGLTRGYGLHKSVIVGTKLASLTIQVEESAVPKNDSFFPEFDKDYADKKYDD